MDDDDIWDKIDELINRDLKPENLVKIEIIKDVPKPPKKNVNFSIFITQRGACINRKDINNETLRKIKSYFIIKNKTIMGYIKETSAYLEYNNKLYIPRFGAFILKNKFSGINFVNKIEAKNPVKFSYKGEYIGNQKIIIDEILNNWYNDKKLSEGRCGLILNLQAGMGKSFIAMALINILQCRTLIVTHNTGILLQWQDLLKRFFKDIKVGLCYSKTKSGGDVVIGVINSLVSDERPSNYFDKFDFVIFDEAHEYCSEKRRSIYFKAQCPYMLGLSATPDEREDKLDKINMWGIGPILKAAKLKGYTEEKINFKGIVHQIKYAGPKKYTKMLTNEKLEIMSVPLMIEQLSNDEFRLKLVVKYAMELYEKNHNIFIFADRRNFLEQIEQEFHKAHFNKFLYMTNKKEEDEYKNIESACLLGGSSSEAMDDAKLNKTIILSTYQYMSTGVSIPKMTALLLATPRKSKIRQIVGRIFRMGSDYSIVREIVDIVDWSTGLKNQWYKRKKYYDEQRYNIKPVDISFLDV